MRSKLIAVLAALGLIVAIAGCGTSQEPDQVAAEATTTTTEAGPTQAEVDEFNEAYWIHRTNEQVWNEAVLENAINYNTWMANAAEYEAEQARAAAAAKARAEAQRVASTPGRSAPTARTPSSGRCGGDLPSCCIMNRESGGSLTAKNPSSTASGKWQFINGTWGGYGGYAEAWMAPEHVQDAKARELWAGGAGAGHWAGAGC